ncbi:MAG: hypothetical protein HYY36_02560, partial [Gammaproteobacteria bacterium]|nr:hypothetical protein [Gammaproteobacteria bacterium]
MSRVFSPSNIRRLRTLFAAFLACLAGGAPQSWADFDPVNDDTDIFLANPNVPANRPNVLLYVDNTANWNQAFTNEKSALKSVVDNITDSFNVGFALFPETGGNNDSVDGGYVRYSIRQMTTDNKTVLSSDVNSFDINDDKGNNATTALGMRETYRYFSGKASVASHGKIKTDFQSNNIFKASVNSPVTQHPATAAGLTDFSLNSNAAGTLYNSPIADECQSNFIIYISNGPANENAAALALSETELSSLGYDTSSTIALTPNGQQGNWMDEWAKYMANADVNTNVDGDQHVYTYVVEVDPVT